MAPHFLFEFQTANFKGRISRREVDTPSRCRGAKRPGYVSNVSP
jgi:hypothetical protein